MPKGVYIRTKDVWNKGKKTNQIPWNKGIPMEDELKKKVIEGVRNSKKIKEYWSSFIYVSKEQKKINLTKYRKKNKSKVKKWKRDDYLRNRDKYIERSRKHYIEHTEIKKEYSRKYQQGHIEIVIDRIKDWKRHNPEKVKSYTENRRAQKKVGGGFVSSNDISALYQIQGGLCYWCSKPVDENYHLDHLIPLSRGGLHTINNVVISCPKCNVTKNNKTPDEFISYMAKKDETISNMLEKPPAP